MIEDIAKIIGLVVLSPILIPVGILGYIGDRAREKYSSCSHCKTTGMEYCVCGVLMCTNKKCPCLAQCYQCM